MIALAEWIRKHPDGSVEEHHTDPGALILKSTPLLAAAFVGAVAIGMSGGGSLKPTVTIAGGGGGAGDSVDWQANWLAFSDTAPNDSIYGVGPTGADAQLQADSAVLYDFGNLVNFTSGVPEGTSRDTMSVLKPVGDAPGNWPTGMGHAMRIKISGQFTANQYAVYDLPTPSVGEFQFRRHYMMMVADSGFNPADLHYFHHGETYGTWWDLNILEREPVEIWADSLYRIRLLQNVNSGSEPLGYINADSVKTHTVYMIETREEAVDANTINVLARIYRVDAGGTHTLWKDTADFRWECLPNGTSGCSGVSNYWDLPVGVASLTDQFSTIEFGVNGSDPQPNLGDRWLYVAGVASRNTSDGSKWIGPFCTPSNECN